MSDLKDKVVMVTGSARGIGWSCAKMAAGHGAKVMLSDVDADAGERRLAELRDMGASARFVRADVSKAADVDRLVKETVDAFGRLDVGVNNAGIGGDAAPIGEMELESWDEVIAINLTGVFLCARAELRHMAERGEGVIVNIASILGQVGFANSAAYVAAKHGVVGLTKNIALEYGERGIRSVAVGPAFIKTPLIEENMDADAIAGLSQLHPQGRLGEPDEVAELVTFLASDRASFVNGGYFPIDGGFLAQ